MSDVTGVSKIAPGNGAIASKQINPQTIVLSHASIHHSCKLCAISSAEVSVTACREEVAGAAAGTYVNM
jgi:hypothetical protein